MFLQRFPPTQCCLCGSSEKLTFEHKIKASALRNIFGQESLVIGNMGAVSEPLRPAQSANSKKLKFDVPICQACNTARTQTADREFDHFHGLVMNAIKANEDPIMIFDSERYRIDSDAYLNLFRYFAKLLCCHIAAVNGPIPRAVAQFAISVNSINRVWLEIKRDPTYYQYATQLGPNGYAAHGGLIVYGDKETLEANAFHSTLTVGLLQYVFNFRLESFEKLEIRERYPDFLQWCVESISSATTTPISDNMLVQLGLKR